VLASEAHGHLSTNTEFPVECLESRDSWSCFCDFATPQQLLAPDFTLQQQQVPAARDFAEQQQV
jgi:hypothetical protein